MKKKLTEKGGKPQEIKALLKKLTEQGWLNDEDLAARFIKNQQEKGYGPPVIKMKLREKAGDLPIEIEESPSALADFIRRKYARDLPEKKDKVIAALLRRGHSYENIKDALK